MPSWKKSRRPSRISLLAIAATLYAADPLYESAVRKLDAIENRQVKHGSSVVFSPEEINAWARLKVPEIVPEGIRGERVELAANSATGSALVDLLRMRHAKGESTNWLVAKFIEGERPLKVSVRLESGAGRCVVYLTRVELGRAVATQAVTDILVNAFFRPLYPEAKINEPFDLDYDIDRIDIAPTGIRVAIKR